MKKLVFEPNYYRYVHNAFAPVGLMLNVTEDQFAARRAAKPGGDYRQRSVRRLARNGATSHAGPRRRPSASMCSRVRFPLWEARRWNLPSKFPTNAASMKWKPHCSGPAPSRTQRPQHRGAQRSGASGSPRHCGGQAGEGIVEPRESGPTSPEAVADGLETTRWSSTFSDPQWIAIDLEKVERISRVVLQWDPAYAKAYSIEVSLDGKTWKEVYRTQQGKGQTENVRFAPVDARWVRMTGTKRATKYGYSLWEMRVYKD